MLRGADEHGAKKRSFAFAIVYIKCFRTYSVYLSLRLPAQILYAGIHLCPLAVSRSCFGYSLSHLRTAAACLSRCIRHRRRSKAKPLRGRQGRSRAAHRIDTVSTGEPRSALRLPRQARRKALAGDFFCFSYGQKRKNFVIYNCTKYQSEERHEPRKQKERI